MKKKSRKPVKRGRKRPGMVRHIRAPAAGPRRSRRLAAALGELYRPIKKPVTLRLDADVLAWFKKAGRGYQTRINRVLRSMMMEHRRIR